MTVIAFPNGIELSFLGQGSSVYTEAPDMYEVTVIVDATYHVMGTSLLECLCFGGDVIHGTAAEMQKIMDLIEMQPIGGHQKRSIV